MANKQEPLTSSPAAHSFFALPPPVSLPESIQTSIPPATDKVSTISNFTSPFAVPPTDPIQTSTSPATSSAPLKDFAAPKKLPKPKLKPKPKPKPVPALQVTGQSNYPTEHISQSSVAPTNQDASSSLKTISKPAGASALSALDIITISSDLDEPVGRTRDRNPD